MRLGIVITVLLGTAGTGSALTWRGWQRVSSAPAMPTTRLTTATLSAFLAEPEDSLTTWADMTVTNDPFRISNEPPDAAANPTDERVAGRTPAGSPGRLSHPELAVKAIVGGPPWQAVLSGIPGQTEDVVVQAGNAYGGLTIRRVTADTVVVQGADTTWRLTMRRGGTP